MDVAAFQNSPSGRLVKVGQGEAAYLAFAPEPLPPVIAPDLGLMRLLPEAGYALGELAAMGRALPNPHLLMGPFLRREAVLSSRIEGTQATVADLYAYEAGQPSLPDVGSSAPASDILEVLNYVHALQYGLDRLNTLPVSRRLIREIHERLMQGVRGEHLTPGEFRRSQNWIGAPGCTLNEADYVPPPVPEMEGALDALESYIHSDDPKNHTLVRLALIHYQFEAIHPFLDGNGRVGRLLLSLLLVSWDLLPLPLLYLSDYFERNRQQYYNLLLATSQRGDWIEWISFFLIGVVEQSADASARAKRLQDLQAQWRARLSEGRATAVLLSLADSLFISPVLTITQAQRLLKVTFRSAKRNIDKLVEEGILRQAGTSSYGKSFVAQDILRIAAEREG